MAMASPDFAGSDNTLEVLREFLQNMKRTVERLYAGHTLAARQTLKHGSSDAQSSFDFGMLSTQSKGFTQTGQNIMPDGGGKPGQMQNLFYSQTTNSSQGASKHILTGKTNLNVCSSEMDIGNALSVFLEDMKTTIEAWSNRYHLLLEGKNPLIRGSFDVGALPQRLESNVQVIDQLDFGADADRDFSVMEVLDLPNAESLQGSAKSRTGKAQKTQGSQGRKSRKAHIQGTQNRADATSFSLQDFNEVMGSEGTLHGQDSRLQSLVAQDCAENDCHANNERRDIEQPGYNSADHSKISMDKASRNDRQGVENSIVLRTENVGFKTGQKKRKSKKKAPETPVNSQELTIRRFQYKIEVVESPDWLPKGWITELKTRSTGGSAGSKDKYYFDPVSNRRCRSQKEVFSLLETGKLGRYKRKTKAQPAKKSEADTSPTPKTRDIAENSGPNNQEAFGEGSSTLPHQVDHESTDGNVPPPLAPISHGAGQIGVVNNMFVPYRPGQPSDWLVYESLANMPRPVLENLRFTEPNPSKPNGERGSTPWPWFLNNAESSMRPFVDRFEVGKAAVMGGREDMLGNGQFNVREPHFTDLAAKRARKPSKRAAVS